MAGDNKNAKSAPDRVRVVLVSPDDHERNQLRNILGHSNWALDEAITRRSALRSLVDSHAPAVIATRILPDGTWRGLLNDLGGFYDPPNLIVISESPNERLRAEVLNLGAYDILPKPFNREEVIQVVRSAWLNWKDRAELRSTGFLRTAEKG